VPHCVRDCVRVLWVVRRAGGQAGGGEGWLWFATFDLAGPGACELTLPTTLPHHPPPGNGTEEIIENLAPHKEEVRLSGPDHFPWGEASFTATKYKPWLNERDAEEVLFVSVHGFGGRNLAGQGAFYPGACLRASRVLSCLLLCVLVGRSLPTRPCTVCLQLVVVVTFAPPTHHPP
jgi:hypothetical protein